MSNSPSDQNRPAAESLYRRRFGTSAYVLIQAAIIGILSGWSVGVFKLSIESVRKVAYGSFVAGKWWLLPIVPLLGGAVVALLAYFGGGGSDAFPPGLRGTAKQVDDMSAGRRDTFRKEDALQFLRKTAAAIFTLGTGCSLGPEGPAVEVGMSMSKLCMGEVPLLGGGVNVKDEGDTETTIIRRIQRNRLLLSCGAAAGVSAGFNAPIAGVFFALEIVGGALKSASNSDDGVMVVAPDPATSSDSISAILLASVLSALTSRGILGDHLILEVGKYTLNTPLTELPLYLLLGAASGLVAFLFSQAAKLSKSVFDGDLGPTKLQTYMRDLRPEAKPVIGGLLCGLIGLAFPQILFFGYDTLNGLLANTSQSTPLLLSLLFVKLGTTALSAGSGLVGGTFAPSLFLGAMLGASFHNVMSWLLHTAVGHGTSATTTLMLGAAGSFQLADMPAYAMVGAASVLAALFRAPLTASLLLFELTRDYDVILPLMASAGVGSLVSDLVEEASVSAAESEEEAAQRIEELARKRRRRRKRRDADSVSWGDLADAPTVEKVKDDDALATPGPR